MMMVFGLVVKHGEYIKFNWRMPPSFDALINPIVNGARDFMNF